MKKVVTVFNLSFLRYVLFVFIFICFQQTFAQVKYQVNGNVFLEDKLAVGTHEGVSIKFFNLPDMTLEDSTQSLADGSYSINISPGYYLVRWEKDAYVPEENGGLALAADVTLDDITLIPGEVLEVSGNVSGTWTTSYVYFVTADIQVPAGYTLTINPGVKVRFASGVNFNSYGTLKILGTEANRVTFTSLLPSPTPGDWGKLTLYAPNNIIKYLDYSWATNGIYGDGASNTIIEHLNIDGSLKLGANGMLFGNSSNVSFKYNNINASGSYGIFISSPQTSYIVGNTITGNFSDAAIYAQYLQSGKIDSNAIVGQPYRGVYANSATNTSISYNNMSVSYTGIEMLYGSNYSVIGNKINNFSNYGVYFTSSTNSVFEKNRLVSINNASGFYGSNVAAEIRNNYINIENYDYFYSKYGIYTNGGTIENDTIIFKGYYDFNCILSNNATIKNNYLEYDNGHGNNFYNSDFMSAIRSYGNSTTEKSIIDSNYILIKKYGKGIATQFAEVTNNTIINENNYNYTSGIYSETNSNIKNNIIENTQYGLYLKGSSTRVDSNKIFVTDMWALNLYTADVSANNNLLLAKQSDAIFIDNQSNLTFINNTVVTDVVSDTAWNQNQGSALNSQNLSTVKLINNTFSGFRYGLHIDNSIVNYNIKFNNLWDIESSLFSGTAMPPLIGNMVDQNENGDPADIYNNISFDPEFANLDSSNYTLRPTSHLINAGDPTYKDADNTVSDIGAYQHYIYVVVEHEKLASTSDETGPYTVNATISSPSGAVVSGKLFYSVNGGSFNELSMTSSGSTFTANIPGQQLNSFVEYYIEATDGEHNVTSPYDISKQIYSFHITLFSSFSNLAASSRTDGSIKLSWNRPTPTEGTFLGFKLYKSSLPNFIVNDTLLLAAVPTDSLSIIDAFVKEGHKYYYKLGGLLDLNSTTVESIVSEEVNVTSDNATIVRVTGQILLEGTTDYAGVKLFFEKVSPSAIQDTFFTATNGLLDKVMHVGIYNIHVSKDGYKPILIGNKFLSANIDLDTIKMSIGGSISLKGVVSGTLSKDNLYFVDGNITIPVGDTLKIEAGTEIKFRGNYRLVANGLFLAVGTETEPIIFTSGLAAPLEGDWGRLVLHNAPNSIIKYCEFYYASNGILLDNCDGTEISYSFFDKHKLNSTGIEDSTYSNNTNLIFKHNTFNSKFSIGIDFDNADNSIVDSNIIVVNSEGIKLVNGDNSLIRGNHIHAPVGGALGNGIYVQSADSVLISNNTIENIIYFSENPVRCYGIYGKYAQNIKIKYNTISGNDNSNIYAIFMQSTYKFTVIGNTIGNFNYAIYGSTYSSTETSIIDSNDITNTNNFLQSQYFPTIVSNNHFAQRSDGGGYSVFQSCRNLEIINNEISVSNYLFTGVSYVKIKDNKFTGLGTYQYDWARRIFYNSCSNYEITNNQFLNFANGGTLSGENAVIRNNIFSFAYNYETQDWVYLTIDGGSNTIVQNNQFYSKDNRKLLRLINGSFANVYKNTFINKATSTMGTAISVESNSNPIISSNLIYKFDKGIEALSTISSLKFNLVNRCNTSFTGTGIPAQSGTVVTVNNNADPSDIYSNIFMDPLFVDPSDYVLSSNSAAINAGDIDSSDIDGTIADIGAYFFNFGYLPEKLKQDSTGNGFIAFSWDITETDSLQGYEPYYKLLADLSWKALPTTTDKNVVISGLTNNSVYSFKLRAIYPHGVSKYSAVVNARPGSATMTVTPNYLIAFQNSGSVTRTINIENSGNRNLTFRVKDYDQHNLNYNSALIDPDSTFVITDTLYGNVNGVHVSKLIIESDDSESKIDTVHILNGVNVPASLKPQHYTSVSETSNKYYFVITSGMLDGALQTGDEIALFANDVCVGAAGFNGVYPFIVTAYAGTTGNGFSENDSITLKLWDYGTNAEGNAIVNYNVGDGLFHTEAFAEASFVGTIYELFQLPILPNRFNLVSSYLMPRDMTANNIFGTIKGLQIAYEDNGSAFIPKYGVNTVGNYDMTEGYHLFTTDSNAVLTMTGKRIDVQNYSLIIQAKRFNSIPYLYDKEMSDTTAFSSIKSKIEILQDDEGGVWIPSLAVNSLGNLKPLKGYQIYLNTTADVNFTYPVQSSSSSLPKQMVKNEIEEPSYFKYNKTGIAYTIVIKNASFDGQKLSNGDEVGVFANKVCVGATIWDTSHVNYVSAWKGDKDLNISGYKSGEKIELKLFSNEFNQEIKGDPLFNESGEEFFEGAPFSTTSIQAEAGIIPKEFELSQNYPNPFNPSTTIAYALPKVAEVNLVVYNILGQKVKTLINGQVQKAGRYNIVWNGVNDFNGKISSGVYIIRFSAGDFVSVKKSILLK